MTTPEKDPSDIYGPEVGEDALALSRLYNRGYLTAAQLSSIRAKIVKAAAKYGAETVKREAARFVDEVTDAENPAP